MSQVAFPEGMVRLQDMVAGGGRSWAMRWFGWFRRRRVASGGKDAPVEEAYGAVATMVGGRMRPAGVPYPLPRDLEEINRLDLQHYILRYALRGNYAAPVENPGRILDVGTGTGRWAREMAAHFPQAEVVGLDIAPPPADEQDALSSGLDLRPPNYTFVAGNVLEGLPFPDASFDFVHMRALVAAIPHDRWDFVLGELLRVTRPGGWVESLEATTLQQGGPAVERLMSWLVAALANRGIDLFDGGRVAERLRRAGVANVGTYTFQLSCGASGGKLGDLVAPTYLTLLRGMGGVVVLQGLASAEQFEQTMAQATSDLASPQGHCFLPEYLAYGQRQR
jgi:ubiquinone/menaquinone biosynthesis C-methylase UbiE